MWNVECGMRYVIALELILRGHQTLLFPAASDRWFILPPSSFIPVNRGYLFSLAKIKQKAQTCKRFAPVGVNYSSCGNAQRLPSSSRVKFSGFMSQSKSTGVGRCFVRPLQNDERMAL